MIHWKNKCIVFSVVICSLVAAGCVKKQQPGTNVTTGLDTAQVIQDFATKLPAPANTDAIKDDYEISVFKNEAPSSGFGYTIYLKGKIYIHQPNIPAIPGNNGFSTENAATKTARLVLHKIKNNMMPPSIDVKELDSIGVLK